MNTTKKHDSSSPYENLNAQPAEKGAHSSSPPELERFVSRLKEAIGSESVLSFSRKCGLSEGVLRSYLRADTFPTVDRLVAIAKAAGRSVDWFLAPELQPQSMIESHSQPLRLDDLTMALQLAEEALEGKHLPREERAELVGIIYEMLVDGLPEAKVLRFARAVRK